MLHGKKPKITNLGLIELGDDVKTRGVSELLDDHKNLQNSNKSEPGHF